MIGAFPEGGYLKVRKVLVAAQHEKQKGCQYEQAFGS